MVILYKYEKQLGHFRYAATFNDQWGSMLGVPRTCSSSPGQRDPLAGGLLDSVMRDFPIKIPM